MKALVYHGPEQLALEELPMPEAGPGEIVVRVEAVGICGSELEGYLGHSSIRFPPLVMGHEFCGSVVQPGSGVSGLSTGDRVIVNPLISCGSCDLCTSGRTSICRNRQLIGIHRPGAFADYVAVPAGNAYRVPASMDPLLASLAEPLAVCIHALKLGLQPFEDLVIFGAGPIGLLALQAASNMGAGRIMVVDRQRERLAFAERLGAAASEPEQVDDRFGDLFADRGVNTVIDCVGVQATREQAVQLVNPGGSIVLVGLGQNQTALSLNHVVRQEIAVRGSYAYTNADFERAVALLVNGKISMKHWTAACSLAEAPLAFRELVDGTARFSKYIVTPGA